MIASTSRYVLDASVAAKWFTRHEEADREKAIALRNRHRSGLCTLVVPEFFLLEILNAVRYSGRATAADTAEAHSLLQKMHFEVVALDWATLRAAVEIAWRHDIAMYDAAYVAIADAVGAPLVTADATMVRRMKGDARVLKLADLELSSH